MSLRQEMEEMMQDFQEMSWQMALLILVRLGYTFLLDESWVNYIRVLLESEAAAWFVGLFEVRTLELRNFDQFMLALRGCFENLFQEEKMRTQLQHLR
uniref:Uncharacterized protein n=1 Tax=Sphaerodactylus townsendi TaxID=933632 RepID=A0ACB8GBN3_9SAUR